MKKTRNIKLLIEYDGTGFAGWQRQPGQRTVQGELEKALFRLTKEKVILVGAGRTDSGTHALGQVANFKAKSTIPLEVISRAVNSLLPNDLLVKKVTEVHEGFNARQDPLSKIYLYRILLGQSALERNRAWQFFFPAKLSTIRQATKAILGSHDFSSFCVAKSRKESNICKIVRANWKKSGSLLEFRIEGNRFLHAMVRILAGTLMEVGRGRISPAKFKDILASQDRRRAGKTAPACGLYLVKVKY